MKLRRPFSWWIRWRILGRAVCLLFPHLWTEWVHCEIGSFRYCRNCGCEQALRGGRTTIDRRL